MNLRGGGGLYDSLGEVLDFTLLAVLDWAQNRQR
jgi:hypothetical protein